MNIHKLDISGYIPWDFQPLDINAKDGIARRDELAKHIGLLMQPIQGLRFSWTGKTKNKETKEAFEFIISGAEAVGTEYARALCLAILNVDGEISMARMRDVEEDRGWYHII